MVSFLGVGWVVGEELVVYNGRDLFTQILGMNQFHICSGLHTNETNL